MKKYWKYFKYVINHKKNVFIECWKEGLYIHAFTHDLSKFSLKEFIPYARFFEGSYPSKATLNNVSCIRNKDKIRTKEQAKEEFEKAWEHHYKNNKHHWNYWIGQDMPEIYIRQMICDWKGMSRKFGDTAQAFYMKNHDKIILEHSSRVLLEFNLGLIDSVCLVSNINWKEYCKRVNKTMEEDLRELGYIN